MALETTHSTDNILDAALCVCFSLESGTVRRCCCDIVNIYPCLSFMYKGLGMPENKLLTEN